MSGYLLKTKQNHSIFKDFSSIYFDFITVQNNITLHSQLRSYWDSGLLKIIENKTKQKTS